jgi:ribosome-binding protein aMBF1 (putative translation factor)
MLEMGDRRASAIQIKLAALQEKGWTLAALADELRQAVNTLEKWKAGQRNPANETAVLTLLEQIERRKRIPKQRRYARGSRNRAV